MQGILLALLIVSAAAQSQYNYEQQQAQEADYAYRGQQRTSTPTNYRANPITYTARISLTKTTYSSGILLPQNNIRQTSAPIAAPQSAVSVRFPAQSKPGYPLLQAYPPYSTAPTRQNPIWNSSKQETAGVAINNRQSVFATNKFNANLFRVIAGPLSQYNLIYSPISLQLLLAFVSIGAGGETYNQLKDALGLPANRQDTDKLFYNLLQSQLYAGNAQLVMANKIYHNRQLALQPSIQQRARNFDSAIEPIDFGSPNVAASAINDWVAQKTQNIIRELVVPAQLNAQTQAMLINAIYFKAKWAKEFSTRDTEQQKFYVTPERTMLVDMMYSDDSFSYGEFPELDATGLELKYENSNISMMILLPNKLDGLADMEQRLHDVDLNSLSARMRLETVTMRIPKFRIGFDIDMKGPLNKLGIVDLFTDRADLKGFFYPQTVSVSQVQHKAYLDVNEAGSEAAAASFIKLVPLSLPNRIIRFTADHPFMFAIRSPQAVFFIGHVVRIQ